MKTEVCVVGGGPAGFVAAIAAARGGAKTTLVESFGFPGGMATAGLVGPISKFNFNGCRVVGGIPWEFVERLAAAGGAIANLPKGIVPFEAEVYRRVAREMLEEAGVECLWQTQVCGEPELAANGAIASVTLSAAGFLSRLEAGVFIDCTASGALVRHHGFGAARSPTGAAQPLSLCFILGGVETGSLRVVVRDDNERSENPLLRAALERAEAQGRITSFGGPWVVWGSTIRPGFVSVNATRAAADVTDNSAVAAAAARMRREIPVFAEVFREADPAFRNAYVAQTAEATGFRECRELKALHRITTAEFLSGEDVPDVIALAAHPMDRHAAGSSAQSLTFLKRPGVIPLSALISDRCPNLFAAGGLIAAEPDPFASIRVQAQCMATGQAAGAAAAAAARDGAPVQALDRVAIRHQLETAGAITSAPEQADCSIHGGAVHHVFYHVK
ncbi:MAG: FAD-dependent oxidoreductase [Kiritimatiellae bacterium]|nr:FAD-dependent oxidoreductase [Kiritimatiellia bacterium]